MIPATLTNSGPVLSHIGKIKDKSVGVETPNAFVWFIFKAEIITNASPNDERWIAYTGKGAVRAFDTTSEQLGELIAMKKGDREKLKKKINEYLR